MRRHAKAATAESSKRLGRSRLTLLACVLAATVAAFALMVGSASGVAGEPVIKATWAADVVFNEATLKTEINPEGSATTYHIEYGETEAYGSQTPELSVGSDGSFHLLSRSINGLNPGTTYHYRVVATNAAATNEGPDLTFTTFDRQAQETSCPNQEFRVGFSAPLPDCRAYEMVSPVDKNGGGISTNVEIGSRRTALNQASLSGGKMTYSAFKAFGDATSSPYTSQYLATRGSDGWLTHAINQVLPGNPGLGEFRRLDTQYNAFTDDLSIGWAPIDGGGGLLRRDNENDQFQVAVNAPGDSAAVAGYSADGSRLVVSSRSPLTPGSPPGNEKVFSISTGNEIHLVSVLPDETPSTRNSVVGSVGGSSWWRENSTTNAVSEDGSRIYWSESDFGGPSLYVRLNPDAEQSALNGAECTEPTKACTVAVSGDAQFWQANVDGSTALYTTGSLFNGGNLFKFDLASKTSNLIAPEVLGVSGASDDLSYVYFVSKANLDGGATAGQRNLYVDHEGSITYIATLSILDVTNESGIIEAYGVNDIRPIFRPTRVTPDGRRFAFQSAAKLTDYDNTAANNGEPAIEVYIYDAGAQKLICVSCNPSGARPMTQPFQRPFFGYPYAPSEGGEGLKFIWTAAWLTTSESIFHSPRALSEDGNRLFFNAFDALVPQDTNAQQDVYQWRAEGTGGCAKPQGCVDLISNGVSPQKAEFVDATPDGSSVFFETKSSLLPQDPAQIDIYVARVGGGFPQPPSEPECVGDGCQNVPPAPNDQTPASATFRGAADPKAGRSCAASARQAAQLRRRAKSLRGRAGNAESVKQAEQFRKRAARMLKKASVLSKTASRCRRENRRAGK